MKIESYVISGPGKQRTANQDNYYLNGTVNGQYRQEPFSSAAGEAEEKAFFAIADGMGGENFGEEAAFIAVRGLREMKDFCPPNVTAYLLERNLEICELMKNRGNVRIGTTFVSVSIDGGTACVTNIGDSRAYRYREGTGLRQLSCDHTFTAALAERGILSKEEARKAKGGHALTQHLGIFPEELKLEPYRWQEPALPGDMFLLCSDGLTDMLEEKIIAEILSDPETGMREKAGRLYRAANENGGVDNITVLIVYLS